MIKLECTTPGDVRKAFAALPKGDRLQVKINSGGGNVMAGQEIYAMLRNRADVDIEVESMAASAASVIAMAGHSTISAPLQRWKQNLLRNFGRR